MWQSPRTKQSTYLTWLLLPSLLLIAPSIYGKQSQEGFEFGSYGRVVAGNQSQGNPTEAIQVVSHGPRLLESSYAELDFSYSQRAAPTSPLFRTQLTLGLGEGLFHVSGNFDADIAIRNLYLEATQLDIEGLSVWVGSRMYRGDDIYLLDFWPLDE